MRRLSMKNKRRKSEASDSESEENGGARASNQTRNSKSNHNTKSPTKRRSSRGTLLHKPVAYAESNNASYSESEERENGEKVSQKSPNKRRKKENQRASTSARDELDNDCEYEVEKLVNVRTVKGRRQFLVRWKGYGEKQDTWENEKDLNCPKLIQEFLLKEKPSKTTLIKINKSKKSKTSRKQTENNGPNKNDKDGTKEFEVEKIIEVRFKKNGTKEFLIRWKGFGPNDDTWEPEKNLNCSELILKFMDKVEKAKTSDVRELRANRAHTKRYTLTMHGRGRRLSKRNRDKQRSTKKNGR
ncbi:chromobox protein homolog 1 isoform X2 [Cardiocondyla obscurior]|uniref:chromobox protein homolog 1 isoform X2 n=1 Tax=Cardiocondyla obscurior TaxID=286306 RepID=UPI0039658498